MTVLTASFQISLRNTARKQRQLNAATNARKTTNLRVTVITNHAFLRQESETVKKANRLIQFGTHRLQTVRSGRLGTALTGNLILPEYSADRMLLPPTAVSTSAPNTTIRMKQIPACRIRNRLSVTMNRFLKTQYGQAVSRISCRLGQAEI